MTIDMIIRPELASLTSIAPVTPEQWSDVRALHRLAVVTSRWRFYARQEIEAKLQQIETADYTQQLMTRRGLAATLCGTLVGTVFWSGDEAMPQDALLRDLYIHTAFTGGGIATHLVDACERLARSAGFARLRARIDLNERPLFYKLGYERERFDRNQLDADTCFPMLVMSRLL